MTITIEAAIGDVSELPKQPMLARCDDCTHQWPAIYLPMNMAKAAKVLKNIACPMCGSKKVFCGGMGNVAEGE